jgi:hypothetical protein
MPVIIAYLILLVRSDIRGNQWNFDYFSYENNAPAANIAKPSISSTMIKQIIKPFRRG